MISLADLAALHDRFAEDVRRPVDAFDLDGVPIGADPVLMGTVNLSRDSTYRSSIVTSTESAVRRVREQAAQGAAIVDLGAESTTARASRVSPEDQRAALVPVVEQVAKDALVSVESYDPVVVEACLEAGARIVNLTGRDHEEALYRLAADHDAAVVICFCELGNVRDIAPYPFDADPFPYLLDHFGPRVERARELGVERIVIDPGMGFYYGNLTDPMTRAQHQTVVLSQCFRLRTLGSPVCNALPHAFDLFEDQFRKGEGFFAVLARLGGTDVYRTHEVAHVRTVLGAMDALTITPGDRAR